VMLHRAKKDGDALYIGELKVVEGLTCAPRRREAVRVAAWAVGATCVGAGQGTAARPEVGRRGGNAWRAQKGGAGWRGASGRGPRRANQRTEAGLSVRYGGGLVHARGTARDVAVVGANARRQRPAAFDLALFNCV
jgi:hypothetical protein